MGHQAVAKGREAGRAEGSDVQGASRPCCSHWAASALRRMPVRSYFRWLPNRKSPSDRREFPWSREKMADRSGERDGALRQMENTSCNEASLKDAWCPGHDMPRSARSGWGLGSGATRGCETVYDMQTARSTSLVTPGPTRNIRLPPGALAASTSECDSDAGRGAALAAIFERGRNKRQTRR